MPDKKTSAGVLLFRRRPSPGSSGPELQVFLVHPGGPFFLHRDEGAWTIPKGLLEEGEEPLAGARREFEEEVGFRPEGEFFPLGSVRQKGGKTVLAWGVEMDPGDEVEVRSNYFRREWPPGSGQVRSFPEVDRGVFFDPDTARRKVNPAQAVFLDRLLERIQSR